MYDAYWQRQLRYGRHEPDLEDVGTRERHLLDLLEDWETCLATAESRPLHTEAVEQVMKELRMGIALLHKQLAKYPGYDYESSRFYRRTLEQP